VDGQDVIVKVVDSLEARKEIDGLQRLADTGIAPQLLDVCDIGNEKTAIIMEYIEGRTLERYDISTLAETVLLLMSIVHSLVTMSYKGIIYPDIHNENIMVDSSGRAYFIDFGSCNYMAPQMAQKVTDSKGPMIVYDRLIPTLNYIIQNNRLDSNMRATLAAIIKDLKTTKNIDNFMESLFSLIDV